MAIHQDDSGIWQVDLQIGGRRVRRSAGTRDKQAAREFHKRVEDELWRQAKLGERPLVTWGEAVIEFIEVKKAKRSLPMDRTRLAWITDRWGVALPLVDITADVIERLLRDREKEPVRVGKSARTKLPEPGTVNQFRAVISGVLHVALDKQWIDAVPRMRKRETNNAQETFLTREQAAAVWNELPAHLKPIFRFALATGLRKGNVAGLTWDRVNLEARHAWVPSSSSKSKKPIGVPLNDDAMAVLEECKGKHEQFVFTFRGKPIKEPAGRALANAYQRAGLGHIRRRFHLLRHSWASWHAMGGTPLKALQHLGGWATPAMIEKYAHLAPDWVAEHANNVRVGA